MGAREDAGRELADAATAFGIARATWWLSQDDAARRRDLRTAARRLHAATTAAVAAGVLVPDLTAPLH